MIGISDSGMRDTSIGRPRGITVIAAAFVVVALYLGCCGALVQAGAIPLASGAMLMGGLETMGPIAFLGMAVLAALTGYGLLRVKKWARQMALVAAAALVFSAVPAISSAVMDSRLIGIAREGIKIIVAVATMRYLYLEPVDDSFNAIVNS